MISLCLHFIHLHFVHSFIADVDDDDPDKFLVPLCYMTDSIASYMTDIIATYCSILHDWVPAHPNLDQIM